MSEEYVVGPLTDEQKSIAQPVLDAFTDNMCLMAGKYKGQEVAFLCPEGYEGKGPIHEDHFPESMKKEDEV